MPLQHSLLGRFATRLSQLLCNLKNLRKARQVFVAADVAATEDPESIVNYLYALRKTLWLFSKVVFPEKPPSVGHEKDRTPWTRDVEDLQQIAMELTHPVHFYCPERFKE
jgi:hypothetical protein